MSVTQIITKRGETYGEFEDNAAIAQSIKDALRVRGWGGLSDDVRESLDLIATKMSRIVNGDPEYLDNWDDIAGYAQLVANRIRGK